MGSPRLNVAAIQRSRFCELINIPPSDPRFYSFLNECCERLLQRGKYWGTIGRFSVTATSQLMPLIPQVDTIEKVAVCRRITPLRDSLAEFLTYGWGTREQDCPNGSGVWEVLERGMSPTMVDVAAPGGTLTLKCDLATDVGKPVLVLGYDNATPPNWIRTIQGGVYLDGEVVLLAQGAGTATVSQFGRITGIQPTLNTDGTPLLDGQWWIYQGTIADTLLSKYEYWETSPSYKRYQIPFITNAPTLVELIGKLAFIPVSKPTDYPVVQNAAALKLAARAIKAEEESDWATANLLWNGGTDKNGVKVIGALQELDFQLDHHLGSGRQIGLNMSGSGGVGQGDEVEALF